MHRLLLPLALALISQPAWPQGNVYPYRWVFVAKGLQNDRDVEDIRSIAATAAAHGLNGLVLSAGLDRLDLQPVAYRERVKRVKAICDELQLELIPQIFSAGYGGSVISHNRNLAEGLPVRDALFVASGGEARLVADPPVALLNGGLEEYDGHKLNGYRLQDEPGKITFVDTEVVKEGAASLRFENFPIHPAGNARLMQEIEVKPYRQYRVSFWVKTEQLAPASAFRLQVLDTASRALAPWDPLLPATADWRQLTWGFNSANRDRVRIYVGVWAGRSGKFWVDDLRVEEIGLLNIVRRPGTPVRVRGDESGLEYEEGRDYVPVADPRLTFRFDHEPPPIRLLPGSRIREGERLRVDYYHGMSVNDSQVSVCMSEPQLYEIWREQVRLIHELLGPRRFFLLSMDEIRAGGSDEACKRRGMTMGQILGDCITQQFLMLREANPEAEIFIWSDMLDPNHNARADYYLVDGDYTGSWEHVPGELGIVTWYYAKRRESLAHFSGLGFRTLAGAYYDGDTLDNPKGWLAALDETPGAVGIMYTTWQNKYALLAPFGDLIR
ncbi:MAG: hypothetical protein AAB225_06070 [Acidobacteriota bacterium]